MLEHGQAQLQSHFRAVAETAQDAIITIDATGAVVYANPRAVLMFANSGLDQAGSQVTDIIPARLRDAHRAGLTRHVETGESRLVGRMVVVPARRPDGSEFPVELSLASWQSDDGPLFTAIIRDVSERELLLEELEHALARERETVRQLSELNQLKDTLVDTASHDIRSPLGAIRASVEVLERDAVSGSLSVDERQRVIENVKRGAEKIQRLLDDLLTLERLSAGSLRLERCTTDLADLVRTTVVEHGEALHGRAVDVQVAELFADVDPRKVERILENLLLNAVRHTPPASAIEVSARAVDDGVEICVADSGPGIPEGLRDRVFDRFFQVPGSSREGSGLGLSLVARLAGLHGGRAWVEDSESGGAAVRVRLSLGAGAGHA